MVAVAEGVEKGLSGQHSSWYDRRLLLMGMGAGGTGTEDLVLSDNKREGM